MTESDEKHLARLQRCFDAVRDWEPRIGSPDSVEADSSLAEDDQGDGNTPVRSAAWYGLVTAVDHLALLADLAKVELTMRPSSLFTPARAALLGASQTVWVLTGTRSARVAKGLAIAEDERTQHRKFLRDYSNDEYVKANFSDKFLTDITRLDEGLTAEIQRLRALRAGRPYKGNPEATFMMREAAQHLTRDGGVDDQWVRLALAYEWRVASAGAHARSWPMHIRKTESTPLAGGGEIRRMTTSIEELMQSVGAATMMTSEAWRLWDGSRSAASAEP